MFLQTFRLFLKKWIFDRKSTAADLTKMVKILYYLEMCSENIFGKILCSTHQKKCFYNFKAVFFKKLNFWRKIHSRGLYKNGENFVLSQNLLRKYFLATLFVPRIKRSVSTIFKAVFGKLNFLRKIHSRVPLQKCWKFCTISKCIQNVLRKYFSAKLFVPLIIRSVSTIFKAVLGKLNFLQKIHSRDPYKNGENFVLSQNVLRKYFLATLFVPLIKRSVSTTFKAVYGKLNCWQKIHSRGPYKNGENFVLSQNVLRKYFFCKILCSTHQKKCFYKF